METKIVLTINGTTKEEFNLVISNQQGINDILWEVRLAMKDYLYNQKGDINE